MKISRTNNKILGFYWGRIISSSQRFYMKKSQEDLSEINEESVFIHQF